LSECNWIYLLVTLKIALPSLLLFMLKITQRRHLPTCTTRMMQLTQFQGGRIEDITERVVSDDGDDTSLGHASSAGGGAASYQIDVTEEEYAIALAYDGAQENVASALAHLCDTGPAAVAFFDDDTPRPSHPAPTTSTTPPQTQLPDASNVPREAVECSVCRYTRHPIPPTCTMPERLDIMALVQQTDGDFAAALNEALENNLLPRTLLRSLEPLIQRTTALAATLTEIFGPSNPTAEESKSTE
jgi:hypothetical protein